MSNNDYSQFRALVVEDQEFIREMVINLLERMGFGNVDGAVDGGEALKKCKETSPDVVICDIEMEPMDGLEFLQRLRADPEIESGRMPVIYATNHAEGPTVAKAMELGVNAFIVKPVTVHALEAKIGAILGSRLR